MRQALTVAFVLIGAGLSGCASPHAPTRRLLDHEGFVRTQRGQGVKQTVSMRPSEILDALEKAYAPFSDARKIRAENSFLIIGKMLSYAFYAEPAAEGSEVEVLFASPWLTEEQNAKTLQATAASVATIAAAPPPVSTPAPVAAPASASVAAPAPRAPAPAYAASPRPPKARAIRPDDFALVVGIEKYQAIPSADYGERDALAAAEHFKALGVPEENVILLTGARATRTGLAKYLEEWLPRNATEKSRVFVFYSGHGAPDPQTGEAYLVPWDGDPSFLKTSAYPLTRLYDQLSRLKARQVVVALDSCFSGAGGRSVLAKGTRPLVSRRAEEVPARLTVLAAAAGDEVTGSLDDKGHGMFTYYLLSGLAGQADGDGDGRVGVGELHAWLKTQVARAARRQNREQTPQLHAADPGLTLD